MIENRYWFKDPPDVCEDEEEEEKEELCAMTIAKAKKEEDLINEQDKAAQ